MTASDRSPVSSPTDILLRGGRVIDPSSGFDEPADLLVAGGRVARIGVGLEAPPGARVIEVSGLIVSPGFVDLHTHLRYPGYPEKETMQSGTAAAAAGGFTTVCAMANTSPVVDTVDVLMEVLEEAREVAWVHVRQLAAVSEGLRGERLTRMEALAQAGAAAFSDDGKPVWNDDVMRAALRESERLGLSISVHEEDQVLAAGGVANAGVAASRHRLAPWPCAAEAGMLARDLALQSAEGGRLHVAHVSCAETVELLRAARANGQKVTAEVTPHHLRLTDALLDGDPGRGLTPAHPCTKVNPPLRTQADVDALIEALADGTIEAVATDHAPHSAADKSAPFADAAFGFSGIEMALPLVLDLVRSGYLSLQMAIERLTTGPAHMFDLTAGSLSAGSVADVCVFAPDEPWTVAPESLRSLGKNTPLLRTELRGRVRYTIVGGALVYE